MVNDTPIALVRQAWAYISDRDFNSLLGLLSSDINWEIPVMPDVPFAGVWRGQEGVRKFFQAVAAAQETVEFVPEAFITQDESVVVLGYFVNRVKSTGKTARSAWAQVWTARAGKLVSMREYVDTLAVNAAFLPNGD